MVQSEDKDSKRFMTNSEVLNIFFVFLQLNKDENDEHEIYI